MSQPILHTERLRLVPLSAGHLEHELELSADPEVMRYLGGVRTQEQSAEALRKLLADTTPGLGCWAGFLDADFTGYWALRPAGTSATSSPTTPTTSRPATTATPSSTPSAAKSG